MKNCIVVRGAGDLATAVIHKLHNSGFKVVALEIEEPLAIRRQVSFCEAVYEKQVKVENVECQLCKNKEDIEKTLSQNKVALLVDPQGDKLSEINPKVLVDGILAKKNLGTNKNMASLTIALGPGFCAGEDVDIVIETKRGHDLGRIITRGSAQKNTGIPGAIKGFSKERVMHSKQSGVMENVCKIGDIVEKGELICYINDSGKRHAVRATISGVLRGLLKDGAKVSKNLKILDIDPRKEELKNSFTISDKARCIAGGVLEAILKNEIYPIN